MSADDAKMNDDEDKIVSTEEQEVIRADTLKDEIGKVIIHPTTRETMLEFNKKYMELMRNFYNSIERISVPIQNLQKSMSPILAYLETVGNIAKQMQEKLNQFDFSKFHQRIQELLEVIERNIEELSEEDIYIDMDVLDSSEFLSISESLAKENVLKVLEDQLEKTINRLMDEPVLILHKELLRQSQNSYTSNNFIVATMSIYPIIEHFITTWSTHKDGEINPMELPKKYTATRVKNLMHRYEIDREAFEELEKIFAMYALKGYINIFLPSIQEFKGGLQRNSTLHGYHDYNTISKYDYIKIVQLLKATLQLKNYSYQELLGGDKSVGSNTEVEEEGTRIVGPAQKENR